MTLKGLTYAPTGALLAAATTSLPETPQGERNWDYRYAWVRDSTFALWGLYTLGFDREANDFFYFVADALPRRARPAGDVRRRWRARAGRGVPAAPVRLRGRRSRSGSATAPSTSSQHDVWGAVLDSVYLHARSREQLPESLWPVLKRQVEQAAEHWEEPDRGIWEVRGEPQHFVSSKLMCWVALDRGARLARMHDEPQYAGKWQALADQIHRDICAKRRRRPGCVHRSGTASTALDASLLLLPLMRFLPPDDPRVRATVLAIADELTVDGLVLRYRVEETDDGLSGEEGSFTICSFWLVSALVEIGEVDAGPQAVRTAARLRQPAGALRRGDRPVQRPAPGQLPAGVHPPGPDQRRRARHPRRAASDRQRVPPRPRGQLRQLTHLLCLLQVDHAVTDTIDLAIPTTSRSCSNRHGSKLTSRSPVPTQCLGPVATSQRLTRR